MGLAGWAFQIILICPKHMYYCLSIWLRLRELLALLLEPEMPCSLFSNSPVSLSKINAVMSGWHLRGWGQWADFKYTDKKGLVSFVLLQNNQLFSEQIWVGFGGLSLSSIVHEAWCEAALPVLCNSSVRMLAAGWACLGMCTEPMGFYSSGVF